MSSVHFKSDFGGAWVAQCVKSLPSAQVMISGSWDQAPHQTLLSREHASHLHPPLPASMPTCDLSLSNKLIKSLKRKKKKKKASEGQERKDGERTFGEMTHHLLCTYILFSRTVFLEQP